MVKRHPVVVVSPRTLKRNRLVTVVPLSTRAPSTVRNRTHRQQVKRKAANWARRYAGMPRSERFAVLAAIMAVEAEGWLHSWPR